MALQNGMLRLPRAVAARVGARPLRSVWRDGLGACFIRRHAWHARAVLNNEIVSAADAICQRERGVGKLREIAGSAEYVTHRAQSLGKRNGELGVFDGKSGDVYEHFVKREKPLQIVSYQGVRGRSHCIFGAFASR